MRYYIYGIVVLLLVLGSLAVTKYGSNSHDNIYVEQLNIVELFNPLRHNHHSIPQRRHQSIAICLSVQDQPLDIVEFIEWHKYIGVNKIYVFDQGSQPPMQSVIQQYIDIQYVEYYNYRDIPHHITIRN